MCRYQLRENLLFELVTVHEKTVESVETDEKSDMKNTIFSH